MNNETLTAPNLQYTLPDHTLVMPQQAQEITLWIFGGATVILCIYAIYLSAARRNWLPILFLFGGLFSILLEPLADVMGNAHHPPIGMDFVFGAEGHGVPLHVFIAYVWYFGFLNICLYDRMVAGTMTPALWWKTAFWTAVSVTAVEQIPIYYGVWVYYGTHPFKIGLMPLAMAAANMASVIVPSLVIYRLMPILKGWKQLLVLGLVPATVVGAHTGASIPSYIALGQDTESIPYWILQAGTALTAIFAVMITWLVIGLVHDLFPKVASREQTSNADAPQSTAAASQA